MGKDKRPLVVAVASQKGGTGKTTTAQHLALYLAREAGRNVMAIDMDGQRNLTYAMKAAGVRGATLADVLTGRAQWNETRVEIEPRLGLVPASKDLPLLAGLSPTLLAEKLAGMDGMADVVVLDTPPGLGLLSIMALAAADHVIITSQADVFGYRAVKDLLATIGLARERYGRPGSVDGVLLTRYDRRTLATAAITELMATAGAPVFGARIRECTAIKEAQIEAADVFARSPRSNAAKDYRAFCDEFAKVLR